MNKLILGTAQFGSDYGIKHDGQPSQNEIENIARVAWDGGIRVIHTSWQYGVPKICDAVFDGFERIEKEKSHPFYFRWGNKLGYAIYETRDENIFAKDVRLLMAPVNLFDNRFLQFMKRPTNFKYIARSVFLQGLLLMKSPPAWAGAEVKVAFKAIDIVCKWHKLSRVECCLGYVLGLDEIDYVVVGVNSAKQLKELLSVKPITLIEDLSITNEDILDPRRWPRA